MYNLYLTENGVESLIASDADPHKIRRICAGRSMSRRLSRPGRALRLTAQGKNMPLPALERIVLDLWFEDCERDSTGTPT
jgi:hypothetical protein